jgi:hypothetical protein
MKSDLVNRLLAVRAEIATLLARLSGRAPDPEPPPSPAPFRPAAGMRPSALPAEPLDVRGKAA